MSEITETFDFMPLGEAIKNAREKNGLTSVVVVVIVVITT